MVQDAVIRFLAGIFRGLSFVVGITAPPPGQDERRFVLLWLGIVAFLILSVAMVFYFISQMRLP